MVSEIKYRYDFIGLSTDDKPTPATSNEVVDGSTFYESNTSKLYVWYNDQWYEKESQGGGGTTYTAGDNIQISAENVISATDTTYSAFIGTDGTSAGTSGLVPAPATTDAGKFLKADGTWDTAGGASFEPTILTSADYNYPADNPTWLALWLLPTGYYRVGQDGLKVRVHTNMLIGGMYSGTAFYIDASPSLNTQIIVIDDLSGNMNPVGYSCLVNKSNGVAYTKNNKYADGLNLTCYDDLNLADSKTPLSAKQGKVLNDKITPTSGASAPTTSTVGILGKVYIDTTNDTAYMCTKVDNGTYTWKQITA